MTAIGIGTLITADAWSGTIYIKGSGLLGSWGLHDLTYSGSNNEHYYDLYDNHNNYDTYFLFNAQYTDIGLAKGSADLNTVSKDCVKNENNAADHIHFQSNWIPDDGKLHRIRIIFKNENVGKTWYWDKDSYSDLEITTSFTSAVQNTTYNLNEKFSTSNLVGSANYSYVITSPSGAVSTSSSWTPSETGEYTIEVVSTDTAIVAGVNARETRSVSETFTVNVTGQQYYLVGGFNSWTNKQSDWELKYIGDGKYSVVKTINNDVEFKIQDNDGIWYGDGVGGTGEYWITGDTQNNIPMQKNGGRNLKNKLGNGTYRFTFTPNTKLQVTTATARTVTVSDSGTTAQRTSAATATSGTHYSGDTITITTTPKAGYTAVVSATGVTFSRSGNNYTFTMPDNNVTVNVSYKEAESIPVVVYAGSGGSVSVNYEGAVTNITEGKNATIDVLEGDTVSLTASANDGNAFVKWLKNLSNPYQISGSNAGATISDEVITKRTVYVARFSTGSSEWLDSRTAAASRTDVNPIDGYSTFDSTQQQGNQYGQFRFMYGVTDTGLNSAIVPSHYKTGDTSNEFWADLTSYITKGSNFFFGLCSYGNKGNMVGNKSEEVNDSNADKEIKDADNNLLFKIKIQGNNDVSGSAKYALLYEVDWDLVSAIGVRAYDNSKSTNNNNNHGGKVDYVFFYKAKGGGGSAVEDDYIPVTNFYAKDGTVRNFDGTKSLLPYISGVDTDVTPVENEVEVTEEGSSYKWEAGRALKGSKITVTTTIPDSGTYGVTNSSGTTSNVTARNKYYVKGFSFNGITPELLEWRSDGVYTCTYTIPANMSEEMLEITPIYYIKEDYAGNTATFYVNGYTEPLKNSGWGNTLFIYPFYKYYKSSNHNDSNRTTYLGQAENIGAYPGTPVINYGGQLFAQVPLTCNGTTNGPDTNGNPIKGITINNGYFDYVHKDCCKFVSDHKQTYDYDDFQKIAREKADGLHSIYFSFKYFTGTQHRSKTTTDARADEATDRYNDLYDETNYKLGSSGTVSTSQMSTYASTRNGFENLTNALGEDVDVFGDKATKSRSTANTLKVISVGYQYNNSGHYATEWAVYRYDGSNYKLVYDSSNTLGSGVGLNSSIVPSGLVMNSSSSFSNYPAMDGDGAISGYSKLYQALEPYRGYPVDICYESEVKQGNNSGVRCDGRWTYTKDSDYVQSNIKIEYRSKGASDYTEDTFTDTNKGTNCGCKAFFTNSDYYGKVTSDSEVISNTDKYTFEAEPSGSYEFKGWYLIDTNGKESTITETDLTSETLRSGNFTIVARFDYVATGSLTISSSLASGQTGRANTYLGVTIVKADGTDGAVLANVTNNTKPVKVPSSYISSNSTYKIRIYLFTEPTGENKYSSYSCYVTDEDDEQSAETRTYQADNPTFATQQSFYNSSANISTAVTSYIINVKKDIYNSTSNQEIKAIDYVSSLDTVKYNYSIKYNYTSRSFGNQSYTKTGSLTAAQIADTTVVTGTENTADKRLTTAFLTKITPHESDFNKNITWNYSGTQNCIYTSGTNTYTIYLDGTNSSGTVTGTSTNDVVRHGYFSVPYELDTSESKNGIASTTITGGDEYGTYVSDNNTFTVDTTFEGDFTDSNHNLVTAPKKIYDDDNGVYKFFQYWSINTVSGKKGTSKEVAKCFFNEMNHIAYEDYNIVAIYGEQANFGDLYNASEGTTISFLCNTRNQWNGNGYGTADNHLVSGDIVYNDFIVSFKPLGADLIRDISGAETGIIIQQLGEVETKSGKNAKTLAEYADGYSESELTAAKNAATSFVNGTTTAGFTQKKRTISLANINNKNRSHYAFTAYSKYTRDTDLNGTIDVDYVNNGVNYLYRAYSYMKYTYQGSPRIVVSETPTYYTMYDIATE